MMSHLGGGGTPPRSPRQSASKGPSSTDAHAGLYSEPADSVRIPPHSPDCLYSDPVDSIKGPSKTTNPSAHPVPISRLRPVGDEAAGGGVKGVQHHDGNNHRKPPDLYSHVYDHISQELHVRTGALSLNGAAGGGRELNSSRRPPGGQAEGASSPPPPSLEHIYDEPEGCAKGGASVSVSSVRSVYDEAHLEPYVQRRPEEALNWGTPHPPAPRWPKPATAPKPSRSPFARKEPVPAPLSGKHGGTGSNVNNNNNNMTERGARELYSKVSKQKSQPPNSWTDQPRTPLTRSPDIIYDNLGDV